MRKAQAESLSWVFILVAGAIILGFFVYFVFNLTESSSKKTALQLSITLEEKMNAFALLNDQYEKLMLPFATSFEVTCDSLQVKDSPSSQALHHIVFSPETIQGKEISIWTKRWNMPFQVANFFYISNSNYQYVLIYDQQTKEFAESLFIPKIFSYEKKTQYDFQELVQRSRTKNLIVVFFKEPSSKDLSLTQYAKVLSVNGNEEKGRIIFHNEGKSKDYAGEELLIGSIISGESSDYECSFNRALEKLKILTYIYNSKAEKLAQKTEDCDNIYSGISSTLSQYGNMKGAQEISNTAQILKNENDKLRGEGCVQVF